MQYGYDQQTKCLFSWDGDFKYEGKIDIAPPDAFIVEQELRPWLEMAACHFLSGYRRHCVFYLSDEGNSISAYGDMLKAECKWTNCHDWKKVITHIHPNAPLCVAGYVAQEPATIAELCRTYPCHTVYVCPLVEELAAFGALVTNLHQEKPRRTSLCVPNKEDMGGPYQEYDAKLNGDGYGQMANIVHRGLPVLNEMMSCPGISPFYGRVLSKKVGDSPTYIIRSEAVHKFFPNEPLSATHYAATSVPVEVNNTTSFKRASGCDEEKVKIFVSSDHVPNLPVFMNFYKVMSNNDFVGTSNSKQLVCSKNLPVFRYDKGYSKELRNGRL